MSRALDQSDAVAAKVGDPRSVYDDIVAVICSRDAGTLEIELLGKSHPLPPGSNILQDGRHVAIPKVKLVQAFTVARQMLFALCANMQEKHHLELEHASAVMLLMDPEHLTAANVRKRLLQIHHTLSTSESMVALERELAFIDSMLTSPLHRHTKSPTLWYHRRWLLGRYQSVQMPMNAQRDLTDVVLVAADRHPRNYYAWNHMRWNIQLAGGNNRLGTTRVDANASLLSPVKRWCLKHPGDISGWSFLLFCLLRLDPQGTIYKGLGVNSNSSVCKDVLNLALSFNWNHESVWGFLSALVASGRVDDEQRDEFQRAIEMKIQAQPDGSESQQRLQSALDRYTENQC
ncbi:hypothetical protein PVAG01_01188 [Phlyctema vagabunda]|uniref:Protein prenyltransferase alpha subunit n=1 Tax=Phlyctema vagabunda TaxID=108571 RepID=A0ABR4PWE6_9HELO